MARLQVFITCKAWHLPSACHTPPTHQARHILLSSCLPPCVLAWRWPLVGLEPWVRSVRGEGVSRAPSPSLCLRDTGPEEVMLTWGPQGGEVSQAKERTEELSRWGNSLCQCSGSWRNSQDSFCSENKGRVAQGEAADGQSRQCLIVSFPESSEMCDASLLPSDWSPRARWRRLPLTSPLPCCPPCSPSTPCFSHTWPLFFSILNVLVLFALLTVWLKYSSPPLFSAVRPSSVSLCFWSLPCCVKSKWMASSLWFADTFPFCYSNCPSWLVCVCIYVWLPHWHRHIKARLSFSLCFRPSCNSGSLNFDQIASKR